MPRMVRGRGPRLHILMVASEATPFAKTGGLADVVGALPEALAARGHRVTLILPKYRGVDLTRSRVVDHRIKQGSRDQGIRYHVADIAAALRVVLVDAPASFDRPGLYGEKGSDYGDNARRFDLLSLAALEYSGVDPDQPAIDVVHVHDWQTAMLPARLRAQDRWPALASAGVVLTVHNLAFQGVFERETLPDLGLPWSLFRLQTGEFWGKFSFLKAGLTSADWITTVSPTYAGETLTPEGGAGFDGVLRSVADRYVGILNGIDTKLWDPSSDAFLPAHFDADDLSGKSVCKRALLQELGLPQGDDALGRPIVGMVSRLTGQKGLDLIDAASRELVEIDASWVFLGAGEARYERLLREMAAARPTRVAARIGFDEGLAHRIEAGADLFMMPSQFEPCGLNQMYSLRYGTIPIVRAVGGLHDTIQPYTARAKHANGFKFHEGSGRVLAQVTRRAARLYHDRPVWRRLMANAMAADHSWATPAREYVKVYRRARADGRARGMGSSLKGLQR